MNMHPILVVVLAALLAVSWAGACVIYRAAEIGGLVAPIDARQVERLTVIAVGTGGPYENPERLGPSTAIAWQSHVALVDAGRGIAEALRAAQIPVHQPEVVYVTHLMPVNTLGIDDLLFTGWLAPRETPLRVVGPVGTAAFVERLLAAYSDAAAAQASGLGLDPRGAEINVEEVGDAWSEEVDGLQISAAALEGGPLPALAWRFERDGRSIVVSGTSWDNDRLAKFASGVDLLVHEAVAIPNPDEIEASGVLTDPERLRRESALHASIRDAGKLAQRSGVGTLGLVRMRPPPFLPLQVEGIVGEFYEGPVWVPADGDEFQP